MHWRPRCIVRKQTGMQWFRQQYRDSQRQRRIGVIRPTAHFVCTMFIARGQ